MRYFHLYFVYLKRAIISRLEYKKDTIIGIIGFLITNAASLLSLYFIVRTLPNLEGWTMEQLGFLYGFSMLPVAIDHFFSDDLWNVSYWKVKGGELDRYFLKPVPVLFQVIAECFQPEAFGELIVGIAMTVLCGSQLAIAWTFGKVLLIIVSSLFGALLITSLKIFCAAVAFWFQRSGPLTQLIYNFLNYTKYPIRIYPVAVRAILTFVIPFALVISYPVETILMGTYSPYWLSLIIAGGTIILFILSVLFWNWSERRYQSSGS